MYSIYDVSLSNSLIWEYLVFQFQYYHDQNTRFGKGNVRLNWFTGEASINRWLERDKELSTYLCKKFCTQYSIKNPNENKFEVNTEGRKFYNKLERRRFYNTEAGYLHCTENDLFEKFSRECIICRFKKDCEN
jgi:hypothetical protein